MLTGLVISYVVPRTEDALCDVGQTHGQIHGNKAMEAVMRLLARRLERTRASTSWQGIQASSAWQWAQRSIRGHSFRHGRADMAKQTWYRSCLVASRLLTSDWQRGGKVFGEIGSQA